MPNWGIWLLSLVIAGCIYAAFDMLLVGNLFYARAIIAVIVQQISFWVSYRILKRKGTNQKKAMITLLILPACVLVLFCIVSYYVFLYLIGSSITK